MTSMKMDFCENLRLDLREERYSVFEYVRKLQREDVVLEPIEAMPDSKPFVLWNFPEWEPERQSRFIESLIVNLPVPPFSSAASGSGSPMNDRWQAALAGLAGLLWGANLSRAGWRCCPG